MSRFAGLLGIVVLLFLAYVFSTDRKAIRLKTVLWGLGLQFIFAILVVYFRWVQWVMAEAGGGVKKLLSYAFAGSTFVFGPERLRVTGRCRFDFHGADGGAS